MISIAPSKPRKTVRPSFLSVAQVAGLHAVSQDSVRRWIRNGDLEAVALPSGRLRIPIQAVRNLARPIETNGRPGEGSAA